LSSRAKPRDLQFHGPLPETRDSLFKQNCHLDRSVAQWSDLRSSLVLMETLKPHEVACLQRRDRPPFDPPGEPSRGRPREHRRFLALIALLAHFSPRNRATFVEAFSLNPPREWTGGLMAHKALKAHISPANPSHLLSPLPVTHLYKPPAAGRPWTSRASTPACIMESPSRCGSGSLRASLPRRHDEIARPRRHLGSGCGAVC
jgi:hypothetical protein